MSGDRALFLTEKYPDMIRAVAISPAFWTTDDEAQAANPGASASATHFAEDHAVTHTPERSPTRRCELPRAATTRFIPGALALDQVLPKFSAVVPSAGCHTEPFFNAHNPPSLQFLGGTWILPDLDFSSSTRKRRGNHKICVSGRVPSGLGVLVLNSLARMSTMAR
jgi:hypothetical protein